MESIQVISQTGSRRKQSNLPKLVGIDSPKKSNTLDFDIETVAAGFADPNWVPQKITCVAWSWIGSETVESRICTPEGLFGRTELRKQMLIPLLHAIHAADVVTGHNIVRFDLPIVNAECMRLGLPTIKGKLVEDTMRVPKSKGFKKGQDNIARMLEVPAEKMPLDWQAWQDAYDEPGWPTIRERCMSDVIQHKLMRERMLEEDILLPSRPWKAR